MESNFKLTKEEQEIVDSLEDEDDKNMAIDNFRKLSEWEHSLEGVRDNLGELSVSAELEGYIFNTVRKLPDTVKEFVYKNCQFISIEAPGGRAIYTKSKDATRRPWVIILTDNKLSEDYQSVVAHEIAHA